MDMTSNLWVWANNGWLGYEVWHLVVYVLLMTHLTMISVTVFLHRHQAHRALDLHPLAAHVFRFGYGSPRVKSPGSGRRFTANTTPNASRLKIPTAHKCAAYEPSCCAAMSSTEPRRLTRRP